MEGEKKKKALEILVVEDKRENLAAAREAIKGGKICYEPADLGKYDDWQFEKYKDRIYEEKISVDYATDYESAIGCLDRKRYDIVITDLFFPRRTGSNDIIMGIDILAKIVKYHEENTDRRDEIFSRGLLMELWEYMQTKEENQPLGVALIEELHKPHNKDIVSRVVTNACGHGTVGLPVFRYLSAVRKGMPYHKCIFNKFFYEHEKSTVGLWRDMYISSIIQLNRYKEEEFPSGKKRKIKFEKKINKKLKGGKR